MQMQQKDQENGVTPKKHWKALTQGSGINNSSAGSQSVASRSAGFDSPSVASRSAAFETNAQNEQKVLTKGMYKAFFQLFTQSFLLINGGKIIRLYDIHKPK